MDEQPQAPETALPFEPGDQVVGQLDPLEGLAQDELAGMQDERILALDRGQLGEVALFLAGVDPGVAVVVEDTEVAVEVEVDR